MTIFFCPKFIADMQSHSEANFARRVLQKALHPDGTFRSDSNDHRYEGIDNAWIRYVSRGRTAYRIVYLRLGEDIYFYRAGEHHIERQLDRPHAASLTSALPVHESEEKVIRALVSGPIYDRDSSRTVPFINRFRRNVRKPEIYREIFSRRHLPHKDIWLIAPFIDKSRFLPTADFGKLLLGQIEDGASVIIITSAPRDRDIDWMEQLSVQGVEMYIYPRLHTKLYCFVFDESRRDEPGLRGKDRYSSLVLLGSANLTKAGIATESKDCNEELCYVIPEEESVSYVEDYVIELMTDGYDLTSVRQLRARGKWQQLERERW